MSSDSSRDVIKEVQGDQARAEKLAKRVKACGADPKFFLAAFLLAWEQSQDDDKAMDVAEDIATRYKDWDDFMAKFKCEDDDDEDDDDEDDDDEDDDDEDDD